MIKPVKALNYKQIIFKSQCWTIMREIDECHYIKFVERRMKNGKSPHKITVEKGRMFLDFTV